ncbi:YaaC family protein [Actinoplanes sp. NPDC000266]
MSSDLWRDIRAMRAAPAVLNEAHDKRVETYRAALRHAEELGGAAAAAGYASSALPLFYAMEQAGFAISAAKSTGLYPQRHGLKLNLDHREKNILQGAVTPHGDGAFQAVCAALGSPSLAGAGELGALWAANPDLKDVPRPPEFGSWHGPIDRMIGGRGIHQYQNPTFDSTTEPITTGGFLGVEVPLAGATASEVAAALTDYPSLVGLTPIKQGPNGLIEAQPDDPVTRGPYGHGEDQRAALGLPVPGSMAFAEYWELEDRLFPVIEVSPDHPLRPVPHLVGFALPAIAGGPAPHPFMLWWALLFGLSCLVRYYPAAWARAIDPDRSRLAVSLERVLDIAAQKVPERIWMSLR